MEKLPAGLTPPTALHSRYASQGSNGLHGHRATDGNESVRSGGDLRQGSLNAVGRLPFLRSLRSLQEKHAEFVAYQRSLPFKTVVPEPPHTLREYLSCAVRYCFSKLFGCLLLLVCGPFLLLAHLMFTVLYHRQRKVWAKFQRDWPYHSVPHVRPVRYKADAEYPLNEWHLRCEDGRQRWYHGSPLLTPEKGNELGIAQVYGLTSVGELHEQLLQRQPTRSSTEDRRNGGNGHEERGAAEDGAGASVRSNTSSSLSLTGYDANALRQKGQGHAPAAAALPPLGKGERELLLRKLEGRERLEQYQLGLWPTQEQPRRPRQTSEEAMRDGVDFLLQLQDPFSGHWPNDYSGCMFLTPGLIFTKFIVYHGDLNEMFAPEKSHRHVAPGGGGGGGGAEKPASLTSFSDNDDVTASFMGGHGRASEGRSNGDAAAATTAGGEPGGKAVPAQKTTTVPCRCGEATRRELIRYLRNYQNNDGGWGQHTEGHSTMLGTVLSYVSLRLLGVPADDPQASAAREWIRAEGGAVYTPMWGKMWLCILGLFSYDGVPPLLPELVLMPNGLPFNEGKAWCHSRVIAVPFSYLYGLRWSAPTHPLLELLKEEIFCEPFHAIPWSQYRHEVCRKDLYTPVSGIFKLACGFMSFYERHHLGFLRRYALEENWKHMAYDDENTHFICLGPVNKSLNMLVTWIREGERSSRFRLHEQRVADYLYMGPTGMRMNGYNGSQLWDTSFAVQAICACRQEMLHPQEMALAHHYVDVAQVQEDPIQMETFFRHRTKGAWNFSTSPQGWQVSDCTAEGLRVMLLLHHLPFPKHRVFDAVDEILSLRNSSGDGGWASYESTRAPYYCELMNCAELFKDVMVEYSYAECSSSCIHSLSLFREYFPHYRRRDIDVAISEGIACVLSKQRPDGSFYGSWAVCFTYGAWIVADALRVSGELSDTANHPHCAKLINFLLEHQNSDGGWGEDINSCVRQVWVDNPDGSQVVNTAWSVMAIMNVCGDSKRTSLPRRQRIVSSVERAVRFIMTRQLASGDWAQERISGVFNGNNPIHYPGYKNTMTVWALGRYNSWKNSYVI